MTKRKNPSQWLRYLNRISGSFSGPQDLQVIVPQKIDLSKLKNKTPNAASSRGFAPKTVSHLHAMKIPFKFRFADTSI